MRITCFLILFLLSFGIPAQFTVSNQEQEFEADSKLINGKKYSFFPRETIQGHQFLDSETFVKGTVTIQGKTYIDLELNIDICNQQLLYKYLDELNSFSIIELSKAWLERFTVGDRTFISIKEKDSYTFYQVLGDGSIQVHITYFKELGVKSGTSILAFSDVSKTTYLFNEGKRKVFKTKKQFLSNFAPTDQEWVNAYLIRNHIKFRNISDRQMTILVNELSMK